MGAYDGPIHSTTDGRSFTFGGALAQASLGLQELSNAYGLDAVSVIGPSWFVSSHRMIIEADQPGWRSADTRLMRVGTQVLDRFGNVYQLIQNQGLLQKTWQIQDTALTEDWLWMPSPTTWDDDVSAHVDSKGQRILSCSVEVMAQLATYWFDGGVALETRDNDQRAFFDELEVQLHRPGSTRKATMKVIKHPTKRGKAAQSNPNPMTPWALRVAAERLVENVSEDTGHQADDVSLKRLVNLRERHDELQLLMDECAGYLTAAQALLRAEARQGAL